jgi:hypothetical protein
VRATRRRATRDRRRRGQVTGQLPPVLASRLEAVLLNVIAGNFSASRKFSERTSSSWAWLLVRMLPVGMVSQ